MKDGPLLTQLTEEGRDATLADDAAIPADCFPVDDDLIGALAEVDRTNVPLVQKLVDERVAGHALPKIAHQASVALRPLSGIARLRGSCRG